MAAPEQDPTAEADAPPPAASTRELLAVGAGLLVLTALMIAAAKLDMGSGWRALAILAALFAQAALVGLSFMGLRRDRSFHGLIVLVGLLVVIAFIAFTSMDAAQTRSDVIWRAAEPAALPK